MAHLQDADHGTPLPTRSSIGKKDVNSLDIFSFLCDQNDFLNDGPGSSLTAATKAIIEIML
jgi:hypothetical protein